MRKEATRYRPSSRSSRSSRGANRREGFDWSAVFYVPARLFLLALIFLAPWWIGSVSLVAQSVLLGLSVVSLALCWLGILVARRAPPGLPHLAIPVVAGLILIAVQMLPLPQSLAGLLAGHQRDLYSRYAMPVDGEPQVFATSPSTPDDTASEGAQSTRITVHVDGTQQTFNLLVLCLACVLLSAYLFGRRGAFWLLLCVTLNGVLISVFGIIQKINFNGKLYWVITLTQGGSPFGPFVNRNNAGGYLLMTLACSMALLYMAFYPRASSESRSRPIITREYPIWTRAWLHFLLFVSEMNAARFLSLVATTLIMLGTVSTLSRGAAIAFIVGLFLMFWTVGLHRRSGRFFAAVALCLVLVIALAAAVGSNQSLRDRLNQLSDVDILSTEKRVQHWLQTMPSVWDYAPLGSGVGSYVNVHRLYRADREERIFFYAENQFFQTLVEAGPIGVLLLLGAIFLAVSCVRKLLKFGHSQRAIAVCFLGAFLLSSQSIAALTDFGLLIPANAVLIASLCGLMCGQVSSLEDREQKRSIGTFRMPRAATALVVMAVLVATAVTTVRTYRLSETEQAAIGGVQLLTFTDLDLPTTEQHILDLVDALATQPTADGYQQLAELWIHRYRLQLFEKLQATSTTESDSATLNQLWARTSLDQLHALVQLAETRSPERVQVLRNDPIVLQNLQPALLNLVKSRERSPLRPTTHLLLGQLQCLGGDADSYRFHLHRAMELAPANPLVFFVSGLLQLQAQDLDDATTSFQRTLMLSPRFLDRIANATSSVFPAEQVIRDIIPPNQPLLLYEFAKNHLSTEATQVLRMAVLTAVDELLTAERPESPKSLSIHAEVQIELGKLDMAVETLKRLLQQDPRNHNYRYRLGMAAIDADQLDLARRQVAWFERTKPAHGMYKVLKYRYTKAEQEKAAAKR